MNDWFTIEEIDEDTFCISEYLHWEETHCYLLLGEKKALLIDTGLGVSNIGEVVGNITTLPVEVVTTHVHWDHIGGHRYFSRIAVYEAEQDWIASAFPIPLAVVKSNLLREPCCFPSDFEIEKYRIYQGEPNVALLDGDEIDLGNRSVQVIHTPGHSPGHICLYEQRRQYLYSGDLIYAGCLDAFYPTTNPIDFMESVRRVKTLPVKRILPAHHSLQIEPLLIDRIDSAFTELFEVGKLVQGNGIFEYEDFQLHI